MKKLIFTLFLTLNVCIFFGQNKIDVTDQTIKIGGKDDKEFYFGFAQGDKIVFSFEEINQKELKEIEILEYPNNSKFSDFKTNFIRNKILNVTKEGIYIFRFKNSSLSGRICKIKIQRIPSSDETNNFNTNVVWQNKTDTTYKTYTKDVIIGYDTVYLQKIKKELISSEVREEQLVIKEKQKLHSSLSLMHSEGNKTEISIDLPKNENYNNQTKTVISWAYWVGVNQSASENLKLVVNSVTQSGITKYFFSSSLGAYAAGVTANVLVSGRSDDVIYTLYQKINNYGSSSFNKIDYGKGSGNFRKFLDKNQCQGTFVLQLVNDNNITHIDVSVKVIAIIETNMYEDVPYTDIQINPRTEKRTFTEPIITTNKVPVIK